MFDAPSNCCLSPKVRTCYVSRLIISCIYTDRWCLKTGLVPYGYFIYDVDLYAGVRNGHGEH